MKFFILISSFLLSVSVQALDNHWIDIDANNLKSSLSLEIKPEKYRALSLNLENLRNQITKDLSNNNKAKIILPNPDGSYATFVISPHNIMEKKLADKYPQIQTYHGFNQAHPNERIYMDISPFGLHAMTIGGNKSIWIDPMNNKSNDKYVNYFKKDYSKSKKEFYCKVHNKKEVFKISNEKAKAATVNKHEKELREFKIAIATTGEFTNEVLSTFPAGTDAKTAVNSLLATTLSRVNGVFETDIAVRMKLVSNNDEIIFTNSNTDPYMDVEGDDEAPLKQNQTTIDNIIKKENYDVGHLLVFDDGGLAQLNSVCDSPTKAMAFSGGGRPFGDPFSINVFSHELGHQWGADHTFNAGNNDCVNERSDLAAFEPGSGSTIMGYSGICDTQDLQEHSDPYFHTHSLEQMDDHADAITTGQDSCGTIITKTNVAPVITPLASGLSIPRGTPFELCAVVTDADTSQNQLTYSWEQYNLGDAGAPNQPVGDAPIFRSFLPTKDPCRTFPKKADLLNNTATIGEILPTYARDLIFRVTVRDNEMNGGAFNTAEMTVKVTNDTTFKLNAPNGGEVLTGGTNTTFTWDVAGTNAGTVNCPNVDITVSSDGGNSFSHPVLTSTPNDGSQSIVVPSLNTSQARFKVKCSNNVFFDISNANLQINSTIIDLIFKNGFETVN